MSHFVTTRLNSEHYLPYDRETMAEERAGRCEATNRDSVSVYSARSFLQSASRGSTGQEWAPAVKHYRIEICVPQAHSAREVQEDSTKGLASATAPMAQGSFPAEQHDRVVTMESAFRRFRASVQGGAADEIARVE